MLDLYKHFASNDVSRRRTVVNGDGGAPAPCVFQQLRMVGKELDGELAQLVPLSGPN